MKFKPSPTAPPKQIKTLTKKTLPPVKVKLDGEEGK